MHPDEVERLSISRFQDLWLAITTIEAQEFLIQAKVQMLPHITKESRDKLMREMTQKAFPKHFNAEKATLTAKDLAAKMAMRGKYG